MSEELNNAVPPPDGVPPQGQPEAQPAPAAPAAVEPSAASPADDDVPAPAEQALAPADEALAPADEAGDDAATPSTAAPAEAQPTAPASAPAFKFPPMRWHDTPADEEASATEADTFATAASEAAASDAAGQPPIEEAEGPLAVARKPAEPRKAPRRARAEAEKAPPAEPVEKSENMNWYILKVQSNREESIREGLQRRVRIAGLDRYFGDVIVPIEMVTEVKGGKKRVVKRKLYPGYLVVQMEINEDSWFLVRETPGIGDFTGGAGHPTPMLAHEVAKIVARHEEKSEEAPKLKIGYKVGDHVKIIEGTFENFEGEVANIDQTNGRVTVMINIFGRSTPVELEYWQIETL